MPARLRKAALPYLLLLPGLGWLVLFFAIPLVIMGLESLKTGPIDTGLQLTWEVSH
jgi:spermidine/putrescine transport system permease protein